MPAADVTMVDVGEGNQPGSDWWIVAWRGYNTGERVYATYLTDSPSVDDQAAATWIGFSGNTNGLVEWPADRLACADIASKQALACLGAWGGKAPSQ